MPWYRMPGGQSVHINFGGKGNRTAPPACRERRPDGTACGWMTACQCDWKLSDVVYSETKAPATCDRHLCEAHAFEIGPDKHLCPEHLEAYRLWLREQAIAY